MLRNRVYLGEARSGDIVNRTAHEPIVDPATFAAAQVSRGGLRPAAGHVRLLAGVVRCGSCARCCGAVVLKVRGGDYHAGYRLCARPCCRYLRGPGQQSARTLDAYVVGVFPRSGRKAGARARCGASRRGAFRSRAKERERRSRDLVTYRDDPAIIGALGARYYAEGLVSRKQRLEEALERVSEPSSEGGARRVATVRGVA